MISFERFVEHMRKEQIKRFQGRLAIEVQRVKENNGVFATDLIGKKSENSEVLAVCLDFYYEVYREGMALEQLADDIYDMFNTYENPDYPLEELGDFEHVKDKIFYKLVNYDKNLEVLKDIPHVPYLDLAVTFHVMVTRDEKGQSTCPVTHDYRRKWGRDIETLYELAKENTPRLFPASIESMDKVMEDIIRASLGGGYINLGQEKFLCGKKDSPSYVVSNIFGINGAAVILYPEVLKNLAFMEESDLVLLPSSIHEFLLLPYHNKLDMKNLKDIVERINRAEVPETDVLSDNVYLYDRERNKISMI